MSDPRLSKYKPTVMTALKSQDESTEAVIPTNTRRNDRPGFHNLQEGPNNFRIAPMHEGGSSYRYPLCRSMLPFEEVTKDERTGKESTTVKLKSVFNARMHGESSWLDPVEEYVKFVNLIADSSYQDVTERKNFLSVITGYTDSAKKYHGGILPNTKWVVYAWNIERGVLKDLKRVELPASAKQKMEDLAMSQEEADDAIGSEPFTCPVNGMPVCITYDKKEMPANKYKAAFAFSPGKPYPVPIALTSANLDAFEAAQPLHQIYIKSYRYEDFELAMKGLEFFDKTNNYNVFKNPDWTTIVAKMNAQFGAVKQAEQDEEDEEEEEDDEIAEMPVVDELTTLDRAGLKKHIKDNGYLITVIKSMADDVIRERIRQEREMKAAEAKKFEMNEKDTSSVFQEDELDPDEDDLPFTVPF